MKRVARWVFALFLVGAAIPGAMAQGQSSESEAFLIAIRDQDGAKADAIIAKLGNHVVNYRGPNGSTPLTIAAGQRNATYVRYLLGKGAQPDLADSRGDSPLIVASRVGFAEGVELMLGAGARVDAVNRPGETALIVAVQGRHAKIVRRLLEAGANADKADFSAGYSARDYARRDNRNPELLRLIESIKPTRKSVSGPIRF